MLISKKNKFFFIHIYKNAGTSITHALLPFAANSWQRKINYSLKKLPLPTPRFYPQPFHGHIKTSELINEIGEKEFNSYFSFAIVRNPWDWQVSLYKYMLKKKDHFQHEMIKEMEDFDEYIRWRCREEVVFQKDFICSDNGELLVDFVGRFEKLNADFQRICDHIGVSTTLPKMNVSNTIPYQKYYDEVTRELVKNTFEPDISLFNYEF